MVSNSSCKSVSCLLLHMVNPIARPCVSFYGFSWFYNFLLFVFYAGIGSIINDVLVNERNWELAAVRCI